MPRFVEMRDIEPHWRIPNYLNLIVRAHVYVHHGEATTIILAVYGRNVGW